MSVTRAENAASYSSRTTRGNTCITVANLMFEMLCVIADGIASRR